MNIFILDTDPREAAYAHCDKHVGKMITETAQMLMTQKGAKGYRNHPCSVWIRDSRANQLWVLALASGLNEAYMERYKKLHAHKSFDNVIRDWVIPNEVPDIGLTPCALAMPDWVPGKDGRTHAKMGDAVSLYREYYLHCKSKIVVYAHCLISQKKVYMGRI